MGGAISTESYFETGLDVLSDLGYGGLKLAEVCQRLGVTTGSFYHYFTSWSAYTRDLVAYWVEQRTTRVLEVTAAEPDPRRRLGAYIQLALTVPHRTEAAIRVWSSIDADVLAVQSALDQRRFDVLHQAAFEILGHDHQAQVFASWAIYLLIGYEQSNLPRLHEDLEWIAGEMLAALDSGRFSSVPDAG